jgi:hypothetical protein
MKYVVANGYANDDDSGMVYDHGDRALALFGTHIDKGLRGERRHTTEKAGKGKRCRLGVSGDSWSALEQLTIKLQITKRSQ